MAAQDPRKAAERAALDALATRVSAVGEVGVAAQRRAEAADGPAQAKAKATALLTAARAEGRALADAAAAEIAAADDAYTAARTAAVDAGWGDEELTGLGYPPLPRRRRAPRTAPTDAPADSTDGADVALPTQPAAVTDGTPLPL
jgi:hypothetical protein